MFKALVHADKVHDGSVGQCPKCGGVVVIRVADRTKDRCWIHTGRSCGWAWESKWASDKKKGVTHDGTLDC